MNRIYNRICVEHFKQNRQMAFVSGPRQVGKTTLTKNVSSDYFTWDNQNDRANILLGPNNIASILDIDTLMKTPKIVTFDELHKYSKWKTFIKGFFDIYGDKLKCCVTGSARLNIFKKGGDSLMGRYFLYRMHPFSVSEFVTDKIADNEIRKPQIIDNSSFEQLLMFGGFPEPLLKADKRFYNRWRRLRTEQFFHEDIRDLTNVQEVGQLEILAEILRNQTGQLTNYSSLANAINVSVDTVRRWIQILENLYFCFCIRPWSSNVKKTLIKQPKIYLWDWTLCGNIGARNENFVASHLLKAVHLWTDIGIGEYELFYIRDKIKREVDFLVTKNNKPWFLVEVKTSKEHLSPNLEYFQQQIKAEHAFQVTINMDYIGRDCFTENAPVTVPAKTFLSQLV